MQKQLRLIMAFLLVPCLLVDSTWASIFSATGTSQLLIASIFTKEALSASEIETRAPYSRSLRAAELQRETRAQQQVFEENNKAQTRQGFLWGIVATAALLLTGCKAAPPQVIHHLHPDVQSVLDMHLQALEVPLTFRTVQKYRQGNIAELLRTLITFQQQLTQNLSTEGHFSVRDDNPKSPRDGFILLEQKTWKVLQEKIPDPRLRAALALPYSHESFNHFVAYDVPQYIADYGLFLFPFQAQSTDDIGDINYMGLVPIFFEISAIEALDLGPEISAALEKRGVHPTQRLVIDQRVGVDLQPYAFTPDWAGKNYHQAVAHIRSDVENSTDSVMEMIQMLLDKLRIRLGGGQVYRFSMNLSKDLASVESGRGTPDDLSVQHALAYWLSQIDQEMERGVAKGLDPRVIVKTRLNELNDRHEASHWLEQLDPDQAEKKATAYQTDGSMEKQITGAFNSS